MRYFMCLIPPLAFLSCKKPVHAIVSVLPMLTVVGWPVMIIWAVLETQGFHADKRNKKLIKAMAKAAR